MNNYHEILLKYNSFSECIIRDIFFSKYQTVVDIKMDYIWNDHGEKDLNNTSGINLRFEYVQEIIIKNSLNLNMIENIDHLNWGINEISYVKIINDIDLLSPYKHLPLLFQHGAIVWEDSRRIDIVFAYMSVQFAL